MRYLTIIFLLISVNLKAQIIRAQPFYVNKIQYLLDYYPGAAAAYSLRKLDKDYTGNAITVRRKSDNTTSNIGFTSDGYLDTVSLKTFVGTTSSDTGFITTLFDQSGNSRDLSQSTNINQPRILTSGIINRQGNNPTIIFDGSNDRLVRTTATSLNQPITYFNVIKNNSQGNNARGIIEIRQDNLNTALVQRISTDTSFLLFSGLSFIINKTTTSFSLLYSLFNTTSSSFGINGQSSSLGSVGTRNSGNNINVGMSGDGAGGFVFPYNGNISEIIIYGSNQSLNRTGIESNINSYYSIY